MIIQGNKSRDAWIDILNIFACFGVVFLHCTNKPIYYYTGSERLSYYWGLITHSLYIWPVPIFLMLSGYNLCNKETDWKYYTIRRLERAVFPYIIWSVYYILLLHSDLTNYREVVSLMIEGNANPHMWFFIPLFIGYLSMPFLSVFVSDASVLMKRWFVFLSFVLISFLPFVCQLTDIPYIENAFPLGTQYLVFIVLGSIIKGDPFFIRNRKFIYTLAIISCCIHFILLDVLIKEGEGNHLYLLDYTSPTCFIISTGVFLLFFTNKEKFDRLLKKNARIADYVTKIGRCSLGIYVFHQTIFYLSSRLEMHLINPYYGPIVVYLISLAVVLILKQIPFVCKIVP